MRKSGFTLVEVMIGVLLSSVVLGGGYKIWSASQRTFAKANTRQILQTEIRRAIDQIALDFKSIKAGTLDITGSPDGTAGTIKFQRFIANTDGAKIDSQGITQVTYEFNKPRLYRTITGKGKHLLCANLQSMDIARGASPGTLMPDGMEQTAISRMDVSLIGVMKIPGTAEIASHTEKTSVVMRNEYVAAAPVQRSITLAALTATPDDAFGQKADTGMFSSSLSAEALRDMPSQQLTFLMTRETESKTNANREITNANSQLGQVEAQGASTWFKPWTWGGVDTEVSKIQEDLKEHSTLDEVSGDVQKLQNIIKVKEENFIRRSLGSANAPLPTDAKELDALKKAYDLKVKDRSLRLAYEKNPPKDANGNTIPYQGIMASFDESKVQKGVQYNSEGQAVSFSESDEDFAKRSAESRAIRDASSRLNLSWMDQGSAKEEVKQYSAAKDLIDIANVKMAYIQSRDLAQKNIDLIQAEKDRPDRRAN